MPNGAVNATRCPLWANADRNDDAAHNTSELVYLKPLPMHDAIMPETSILSIVRLRTVAGNLEHIHYKANDFHVHPDTPTATVVFFRGKVTN